MGGLWRLFHAGMAGVTGGKLLPLSLSHTYTHSHTHLIPTLTRVFTHTHHIEVPIFELVKSRVNLNYFEYRNENIYFLLFFVYPVSVYENICQKEMERLNKLNAGVKNGN